MKKVIITLLVLVTGIMASAQVKPAIHVYIYTPSQTLAKSHLKDMRIERSHGFYLVGMDYAVETLYASGVIRCKQVKYYYTNIIDKATVASIQSKMQVKL